MRRVDIRRRGPAILLILLATSAPVLGDASTPTGTWHLATGEARQVVTLAADPADPARLVGTMAEGEAAAEPLDQVAWDAGSQTLTFRRARPGAWRWYRLALTEGVAAGRFAESPATPDRPTSPAAYAKHVTGWNASVFDRDIVPRVYEITLNDRYRGRLRIDRAPDGGGPFVGRLKVYSTTDGGAKGEELEHDLQITRWDGTHLEFIRRGVGWTQEYAGDVAGRTIAGTYGRVGAPERFPFRGARAEVLGFGLVSRTPEARADWQEKTRLRLFRLMMAGNPAPTSRVVMGMDGSEPKEIAPFASKKYPADRDDNPGAHPQAYRVRELKFEHAIAGPEGSAPIVRRSHGYLAVPTTPPPPSGKYPTVLAVNGHSGSAWQMMDPDSEFFWYGDAFARRGFVVLALDISHRPIEDRHGLYRGSPDGDDPEHGNHAHPAIKADGLDSDWEEDGERTWDAMRGVDYLLSMPEVDPDRLLVTGLSMGGEVTSLVGALDPRLRMSIPSGYSPDLGVMAHYGNHECWGWNHGDIREYLDMSDAFALTAPRALVIQTGKADRIFSPLPSPFSADKQVIRRARVAYAGQGHQLLHYLHYDRHHYHAGAGNPTRPTEPGLRVPELDGPTETWSSAWQADGRTSAGPADLFDAVSWFLGTR